MPGGSSMTPRVSSRGRMAETDCHQTNSHLVFGCSPNQSSLADNRSVLNIPTVSPHRRRSLRLKAVDAIYKAEDTISSTPQQTRGENGSSSSNHVEVESISMLDDLAINVTLKSLQKRSKSKKRKALKLAASSTSDTQIAPAKPKEEEPDLDEPLIFLKLKQPNKSSIGRKQRKHLHISESIIPGEETIVLMTVPSFCGGEGSSPLVTERSSSAKEVVAEDGSNNIPESVDENLVGTSDKDALHVCGPESGEGCHGEKTELESSEKSSNKLLSSFSKSEMLTPCADNYQLVSATTDPSLYLSGISTMFNITLGEVMHDDMTQLGDLPITDSQEHVRENNIIALSMSGECHNRSDDIPVPLMSICIHGSNLTAEHSILSGYIHDLHHSTGFNEEIGSLNSLVHKAICGNAWRNNSEDHVFSHIDKHLVLGTYDLCVSPQHSNACASSSCDSHSDNVSSKGTKSLQCSTMDETLNRNTEISGNSADAVELTNSERSSAQEYCDSSCPQHPDRSFTSGYAGKREAKTRSFHCSSMDQMLNRCSEDAGTSAEVDTEEHVEAYDLHSPRVLPPHSVAVNDLHNVRDSLSECSKRIQSSAVDYCASSEMPNLVQEVGSSMENELKCNQGMKLECHPKKLLSNRKDLSPTSQEKLRRALNRSELNDTIKIPNCDETVVMPMPEKITNRLKDSRNGSPQSLPKGILKPQYPLDRNCSCSKNSLIHTQAHNAVTFSQRQMQDIETIATKLLNGLTSMKNIVEEIIGSEACPSNSSPEEIRMAIQKASNLESTTKKWLSMMAKDCNRFCKIMKSTENKGAAPLGARRQPRKITFADEAGGLLCHVKVFEQLPSFIVPRDDV